jgi:hypothetical protein
MTSILCLKCGSSLVETTALPTSPVPQLLHTIRTPFPSEIISVQQTISHAHVDMLQLDRDIERVQAVLNQLKSHRDGIQNYVDEHRAVLAPIRRLPPEILSKIFIHCLPARKSHSFRISQAPLLLGRICSGWRSVMLTTPQLWSTFALVSSFRSTNNALCNVWLERSGSCPLTLVIGSLGGTTEEAYAVIATLASHCHRWRHLVLMSPSAMQYISTADLHLPCLESVEIAMHDIILTGGRTVTIENAPRLRAFKMDSLGLAPAIRVPWCQLTEYHVKFDNLDSCIAALQQSANVESCKLTCRTDAAELTQEYLPVVLPHLRSLHIVVGGDLTNLFNHLVLPALRDIHITQHASQGSGSIWPQSQFHSLLSHTTESLRTLVLDSNSSMLVDQCLIQCLETVPFITRLEIRGAAMGLTTETFKRLTNRGHDDKVTCLVPRLQVIKLDDGALSNFEYRAFENMVASRWRLLDSANDDHIGPIVRLNVVTLNRHRSKKYNDWGKLELLHAFRDEGLEIDASKYSPPLMAHLRQDHALAL